jgi:preprotein translocase subunit SecG
MQTALNIVQIIVSIALIVAILFQVKGGGIGGIFGQSDSVFRTKRGIERWLFLGTIVLVIIFIALSMVTMLTPNV